MVLTTWMTYVGPTAALVVASFVSRAYSRGKGPVVRKGFFTLCFALSATYLLMVIGVQLKAAFQVMANQIADATKAVEVLESYKIGLGAFQSVFLGSVLSLLFGSEKPDGDAGAAAAPGPARTSP